MRDNDSVPCKYCQCETWSSGTKLCFGCWELGYRIEHKVEIARKILDGQPWPNGIPPIGTKVVRKEKGGLGTGKFLLVVKRSTKGRCFVFCDDIENGFILEVNYNQIKPWEE